MGEPTANPVARAASAATETWLEEAGFDAPEMAPGTPLPGASLQPASNTLAPISKTEKSFRQKTMAMK
ncbi:MAG: hypothetical protein ABIR13_03280 [Polaromonas sp.]